MFQCSKNRNMCLVFVFDFKKKLTRWTLGFGVKRLWDNCERKRWDIPDQVGPYHFQDNYPIATENPYLLFKNRPEVISKLCVWKPVLEQCFPNILCWKWMTKHVFLFLDTYVQCLNIECVCLNWMTIQSFISFIRIVEWKELQERYTPFQITLQRQTFKSLSMIRCFPNPLIDRF